MKFWIISWIALLLWSVNGQFFDPFAGLTIEDAINEAVAEAFMMAR